jgi:hypothetical protein
MPGGAMPDSPTKPGRLDPDDPANARFAADPSEFTFPGQPDFEEVHARIRREEAYRKRFGEEWLKLRREAGSKGITEEALKSLRDKVSAELEEDGEENAE